jgi:hypothetical protein
MADEITPPDETPDEIPEIIEEKPVPAPETPPFADGPPITVDMLDGHEGPIMRMTFIGKGSGAIGVESEFLIPLTGAALMSVFKTSIQGLIATSLEVGTSMGATPDQVMTAIGLDRYSEQPDDEGDAEDEIDGDEVVDFVDPVEAGEIIDGEIISGNDVDETGGPQTDPGD